MSSSGKGWFALAVGRDVVMCGARCGAGKCETAKSRGGRVRGAIGRGHCEPGGHGSFDAATSAYSVASSGANLWSTTDGFHMVWKKVSGDLSLTADIELATPAATSSPHRKAFLIFRQSLEPDSMYADAAVHGNGETALQYRRNQGRHDAGHCLRSGRAQEGAPRKTRRHHHAVRQHEGRAAAPGRGVGQAAFCEPFYAGLGVCAHQEGAVEKATFSHVELTPLSVPESPRPKALYSTLQTIAIDNSARMAFVIATGKGYMEAPNWSRDGKTLIFDRGGKIWTIPATGGEATAIDIGDATGCTGSHGLSPDGKWLAMTCSCARASGAAGLHCSRRRRRAAHGDGKS